MFRKHMHTSLAAVRHFSAESDTMQLVKAMQSKGIEKPKTIAKPNKIAKPKTVAKPETSDGNSTSSGRDTLGRRILGLIYSKRSAAAAIHKWREEGHTVQKYQLNRVVRELRKLKRYKHALEVPSYCIFSPSISIKSKIRHVSVIKMFESRF